TPAPADQACGSHLAQTSPTRYCAAAPSRRSRAPGGEPMSEGMRRSPIIACVGPPLLQPLPRLVKPFPCETTASYLGRLAQANRLDAEACALRPSSPTWPVHLCRQAEAGFPVTSPRDTG